MPMDFKAEVLQNPYLPCDASRVDAIMSVTSAGTVGESSRTLLLEGLIIDTSGSMLGPRLGALKLALDRVLNTLPLNSWFFILAFAGYPTMLVSSCQTTPRNIQNALFRLANLEARADTVMSTAFSMARAEFVKRPHFISHALFLTDGQNNLDDEDNLQIELAKCESLFQCDSRGVGTDWQPRQLMNISRKLRGTAKIIAEPAGIANDFFNTIHSAMERCISNVRIRIWLPKASQILSVKQVSSEIVELIDLYRLRGQPNNRLSNWRLGKRIT